MHRPNFLLSQAWKTSEIGIISCIKLRSESAQPQRTSSCTASFPRVFYCPLKLILLHHFLHKPSRDESFIVWGQADERLPSVFYSNI